MNEISKDEIFNMQMSSFNNTLKNISEDYSYLVGQRIYLDNMPRDEYMIYDMMDMILSLEAMLHDIRNINADYMVEKLERMKSYVSTTLEYFKQVSESIKKENK